MAFSFTPPTGLNDTSVFPAKDTGFRARLQDLLQQIPTYVDAQLANKAGFYQVRQDAATNTSFTFNFVNPFQFSLVTVLISTGDNANMAKATFLVKNFSGFTKDLLGTKVLVGAVTGVDMTASGTITATASVGIGVRCCISVVNLGSDL